MNQNILIGIGTGAALCAAGIVYSPSIPTTPEAAALFAGILGGLTLLTVVGANNSAATGCRTTGIILIGGFALATGIFTGAAALGTAIIMAGAGILLGRTLLRGGVSAGRLPEGGCT